MCELYVYTEWPGDDATHGFSFGDYDVTVLGVRFCAKYNGPDASDGDWKISGRAIEYDGGLTEEDVLEALGEYGKFERYPDDFYLDVEKLSDEDLLDCEVDYDCGDVFVESENGDIYAFDEEDDIPESLKGSRLECDEAVEKLVNRRQGLCQVDSY